jgi:DNA-binding GntR family transcriptional regulator
MNTTLEDPKPRARPTENLSARIYSQIKNLILCNEVLPGQKLHHQELSDRLGASRTPEREALTRLAREGYVSFLPKRAFTCKEIRLQVAEELYDLRAANVLADLKQRQETRELQSVATVR